MVVGGLRVEGVGCGGYESEVRGVEGSVMEFSAILWEVGSFVEPNGVIRGF